MISSKRYRVGVNRSIPGCLKNATDVGSRPEGKNAFAGLPAAVVAANEHGAKAFGKGSTGRFEVMQSGSSGGVGYWTGIQHADVMMKGKDKPVAMQLRTTEIFRVEDGAWKLIHRHADMLPGSK